MPLAGLYHHCVVAGCTQVLRIEISRIAEIAASRTFLEVHVHAFLPLLYTYRLSARVLYSQPAVCSLSAVHTSALHTWALHTSAVRIWAVESWAVRTAEAVDI